MSDGLKIEITHHLRYKATLSDRNYKDMTVSDIMKFETEKDANEAFCDVFEDEDNCQVVRTEVKITDASGNEVDYQIVDREE